MTIKQLSVFLENKPGKLAGMMKALADADVNIVTLSLANAPEFGIVRVIADDHVKGVEALTKAGFAARRSRHSIRCATRLSLSPRTRAFRSLSCRPSSDTLRRK